jgi:hypothetical protein
MVTQQRTRRPTFTLMNTSKIGCAQPVSRLLQSCTVAATRLGTSFAAVAVPSMKFPRPSNVHRSLVHPPELLQVVPLSMSSTSLAAASSSEEILGLPPASSTPLTASPFAPHSFSSLEPRSHFHLVPHSLMCSSPLSLIFQFIPSFPI